MERERAHRVEMEVDRGDRLGVGTPVRGHPATLGPIDGRGDDSTRKRRTGSAFRTIRAKPLRNAAEGGPRRRPIVRITVHMRSRVFPGTFVAGTPDKPAVIRPATGEQSPTDSSTSGHCGWPGTCARSGCGRAITSRWSRATTCGCSRCTGRRCDPGFTSRRQLASHPRPRRRTSSTTARRRHWSSRRTRPRPSRRIRPSSEGALPIGVSGERSTATTTTRRCSRSSRTNRWNPSRAGKDMLYSSGTTGRPKGDQTAAAPRAGTRDRRPVHRGFRADVRLRRRHRLPVPAPLYHAAPLRFLRHDQLRRRDRDRDGAVRRGRGAR